VAISKINSGTRRVVPAKRSGHQPAATLGEESSDTGTMGEILFNLRRELKPQMSIDVKRWCMTDTVKQIRFPAMDKVPLLGVLG